MKWIFAFLFSSLAMAAPLGVLHVQDGGRIKPLDTFARESLQLIYGKTSYHEKAALDVMMTWILAPQAWQTMEFFEVRHSGLRSTLHLSHDRFIFTPQELEANDNIGLAITELRTEKARGGKLNPYFQAVMRLENQLSLYIAIRSGEAIRIVPQKTDGPWRSLKELDGELKSSFLNVTSLYSQSLESRQKKDLQVAVDQFRELARAENPAEYGSDFMMKLEVHYNHLHPFRWAWSLYLTAVLLMAMAAIFPTIWLNPMSWSFVAAGMSFHIYGIVLRSIINGRPPVSNMYETVVWVPLGVLVISLVLSYVYQFKIALVSSLLVAILCLILTDVAPVILDSTLQPLEPVLRSTFWLSTHVVIITLSYAGFFLAFAIGDFCLFYFLRDEKRFAKQIAICAEAIYRSIQVGVVLLSLGIILGGIWADYSWGRFWGWDPKETWALIALLGYVALLHGRLVGLVRNFGMAAGAVIAFSLVIMAWYGVNFVLGAGLHSYGFGAGGVEYVTAFVALHILYVIYVSVIHRRVKRRI